MSYSRVGSSTADGSVARLAYTSPMNGLHERWTANGLFALLWVVGRLPLRLHHGLGRWLGDLMRWVNGREWRVARRNLALCVPELGLAERDALARESMRETGCPLLETCRLWSRPLADGLALIREVENAELLEQALARGKGVIVAAPHLGNWELLSQYLASKAPISVVYRPPRQAFVERVIQRGRHHPGVSQVRAEAAGVRSLFRTLLAGGMLGILPDQQPKQGDGEFAPFFGIEALTMSLLTRLLQRSEAEVVFAWAQRLPASQGFKIVFLPGDTVMRDADSARAIAALNRGVEACVRRAMAQYQWGYKRFSISPPGQPHRYDGHL